MKGKKRNRTLFSFLVVLAIVAFAQAAFAVSLTVTNDVHLGTPGLPDSGFALTSNGALTLGNIQTTANVSASATGATSQTVSDTQSSPADQSGAFAFATLNPGDVIGTNSAADGVASFVELQNFNAAATATHISDGTPGVAHAVSDYTYKQFFTVDPGSTVNYHFDFASTFDLLDPAAPGETASGTSLFQFMLVSLDSTGAILDSVAFDKKFTGTGGYLASDLSLAFAGGTGYWQAFTSADVTASGGPAPVPEPATLLLLGSGIAGLAAYRRRKSS